MGSLTTNVTDVTHEVPDIIGALRRVYEEGRKELTQRLRVARTFYLGTMEYDFIMSHPDREKILSALKEQGVTIKEVERYTMATKDYSPTDYTASELETTVETYQKVYITLAEHGVFGEDALRLVKALEDKGVIFAGRKPKKRGRPAGSKNKVNEEKEQEIIDQAWTPSSE